MYYYYYYYYYLYTQKVDVNIHECENYLASIEIPALSDNEAMLCEGLISEEECREAIFSMKTTNRQEVTVYRQSFINVFGTMLS